MLLNSDLDPWLQVFGRFHIVLLHLPIGLLPGMAMLEFGAALIRKPNPRGAVMTLAVMTALCAGAALASGLVLAGEKTDTELLGQHKLAAIVMAIGCACLPIFGAFKNRVGFRIALLITMALSVWAGHLGGSLTHKKDFLFKPLDRAARMQATNPDPAKQQVAASEGPAGDPTGAQGAETTPTGNAPAAGTTASPLFSVAIAPIFKRACNDCHNATDFEGDLDLTTKDGILCLDRDEAERVLVPGKPDESYLVQLCELPLDDEDHMPPADKDKPGPPDQLSKAELQALRQWILAGCKFD
jgi:hypothetical protein